MGVPARTSEVGTEFLTEILRESGVIGPATRVEEIEHEQIGVGIGLMGELGRLQLRYAGPASGAPRTVVLKVPSQSAENRAVGEHFRFYEREGRFYQQLAGKVGLRVPRCYWACVEPDRGDYALLLEDLSERVSISQVSGADAARSRQAIDSLAKLHAAWWDAPELDGLEWMPRIDDPVNLAGGEQYRQAWPAFLERVGKVLPEGAVELGERIQDQFERLLGDAPAEAPLTVCHGDYRLDNLLFSDGQDGDDPVAVVDWQISFKGAATGDLTYFLCQSLQPAHRRHLEQSLVEQWYSAVAKRLPGRTTGAGIPGYPFEDAWRHYRKGTLANTVYPVAAAGALDPANERGRELVETVAIRAFSACIDLGASEFLS